MTDTKTKPKTKLVLILTHDGRELFHGQATLSQHEIDPESGCKIAMAAAKGFKDVQVWQIGGKWQGWLH